MFNKKYSKVFVISITFLEKNQVKIRYLLDFLISISEYKGLFEFSYVTDNSDIVEKLTVGKWQKVRLDYVGHIVYIPN